MEDVLILRVTAGDQLAQARIRVGGRQVVAKPVRIGHADRFVRKLAPVLVELKKQNAEFFELPDRSNTVGDPNVWSAVPRGNKEEEEEGQQAQQDDPPQPPPRPQRLLVGRRGRNIGRRLRRQFHGPTEAQAAAREKDEMAATTEADPPLPETIR